MNEGRSYAAIFAVLLALVCVAGSACRADTAADLQRAKDLIQAGKCKSAESILSSIVSDSQSFEALAMLGECYAGKRDYAKALDCCERALARVPEGASAEVVKETRERAATCREELAQWDKAIAAYERLIKDYPEDATNYYYKISVCYNEQGKLHETAAALEKGFQDRSLQNLTATLQLILEEYAWAQSRLGNWDKAIDACRKLLADNPGPGRTAKWQWMMGDFYKEKGDKEQAKTIFREVIAKYPKEQRAGDAYLRLAICLTEEGKTDEGLAVFDKFIEQQPDKLPKALVWKGEILAMYAQDYDRAIPFLREFVNEFPSHGLIKQARTLLLLALEEAGRMDEAAAVLKSGISSTSTPEQKAKTLDRVAGNYFRDGKYTKALATFAELRALKDAPEDLAAKSLYYTGACYYRLGNPELAQETMKEVVSQYPNSSWATEATQRPYGPTIQQIRTE